MSTKYTSKIALVLICVIVALTVCSCTESMTSVMQEVNNIKDFAADIVDVTSTITSAEMTDEERIEKVEALIHPKSSLKLDNILDELTTNEKIQDLGSIETVEIVKMPTIEDIMGLIQYDEELGGNVYHTEVEVAINGVNIIVGLTLFSDENGMGIYGYNID